MTGVGGGLVGWEVGGGGGGRVGGGSLGKSRGKHSRGVIHFH